MPSLIEIAKTAKDSKVEICKILLHGTSEERWKKIRRQGIRPSKGAFGRAAYLTDSHTMGAYYATGGDDHALIDRYHQEKAGEIKRPHTTTGRMIFVDDTGGKGLPHATKEDKAYRRTERYEYLRPGGVDPRSIVHSQNVHERERIMTDPRGTTRRWYNRNRAAGTNYKTPLDDPKIAQSIIVSQDRKRAQTQAQRAAAKARKVALITPASTVVEPSVRPRRSLKMLRRLVRR